MAATRLFLWIVLIGFALVSKSSMNEVQISEISEEIMETFNFFDKDGDGSITVEELGIALGTLGYKPTNEELKEMIADHDVNGNGTLEIAEFDNMMSDENLDDETILEQFQNAFDVDGDGFINYLDLHSVMARTGQNMSEEECKTAINKYDTDGDGKLDFTEFVKLLTKKKENEEDENLAEEQREDGK